MISVRIVTAECSRESRSICSNPRRSRTDSQGGSPLSVAVGRAPLLTGEAPSPVGGAMLLTGGVLSPVGGATLLTRGVSSLVGRAKLLSGGAPTPESCCSSLRSLSRRRRAALEGPHFLLPGPPPLRPLMVRPLSWRTSAGRTSSRKDLERPHLGCQGRHFSVL